MASSNVAGCSTGRSAGREPFRRPGRLLDRRDGDSGRGHLIPEDGHARDTGHGLPQQLQPLHAEFRRHDGEARHVAAGPGEARHQPAPHGIADVDHDDGDGRRGLPGCPRGGRSLDHDDVHALLNELGRQGRQRLHAILGVVVLDGDIAPLDMPELPQTPREGVTVGRHRGRGAGPEEADARRPARRRLRLPRERAHGGDEGESQPPARPPAHGPAGDHREPGERSPRAPSLIR